VTPPKVDDGNSGSIGGLDPQMITAFLDKWLESRIDKLKGPKGDAGPQGPAGVAGLPGKPGVTPAIDYDEIAKRMTLRPIYIGSKDFQGNITMQAAPVHLGDTVYIRVDPPKLTESTGN
jgi:hypothetical protein